jgi:hypothetical protein
MQPQGWLLLGLPADHGANCLIVRPPKLWRFGHPVKPREWFLVPLQVIDEAVQRIRDRSIVNHRYEPQIGELKPHE